MKSILMLFIGFLAFSTASQAQKALPDAIYTSQAVSISTFENVLKSVKEAKFSVQTSDKNDGTIRANLPGSNTNAVNVLIYKSDGITFIEANFSTNGSAAKDLAKLLSNSLKNNFPDLITTINLK